MMSPPFIDQDNRVTIFADVGTAAPLVRATSVETLFFDISLKKKSLTK
jgi:hypothetical protein